jgi:hypothetical protein
MKRLSVFIFVFIFILVFFLSGEWGGKSRIIFEATEMNFGDIDEGKIVDLTFKFKNAGDETLIIKNINSSCGCTVPRIEKMEYQPGETGIIPVKFNSRGLRGKIFKIITITTNDNGMDNTRTTLKIKGTVILKNFAMAKVETNHVPFNSVKLGEEYSKSLKIANTGTADLRIIEVAHSPQVYLLFDKDVVAPGKEMEVKIVLTPMHIGRSSTFIRFRTNSFQKSFAIVKVSAEVKE